MLIGGLLHAVTSVFTTVFGFLVDMVPSVPGWVTGSSSTIQDVFSQAVLLEPYIPIVEAVGVAKDVALIWGAAALLSFVRQFVDAVLVRRA